MNLLDILQYYGAAASTIAAAIVSLDLGRRYLDRVTGDVKLARPMKVAIDCGNGVAGAFAPALFLAA